MVVLYVFMWEGDCFSVYYGLIVLYGEMFVVWLFVIGEYCVIY